ESGRTLKGEMTTGIMLRRSKHGRSGLYNLLGTRARAFTRILRVPQDDMPPHVRDRCLSWGGGGLFGPLSLGFSRGAWR
ncbi:MAG: hypothetical protein ABIN13_10990, partial [Mucilaginibacter sp.]